MMSGLVFSDSSRLVGSMVSTGYAVKLSKKSLQSQFVNKEPMLYKGCGMVPSMANRSPMSVHSVCGFHFI